VWLSTHATSEAAHSVAGTQAARNDAGA
jgi:hypothetical protein